MRKHCLMYLCRRRQRNLSSLTGTTVGGVELAACTHLCRSPIGWRSPVLRMSMLWECRRSSFVTHTQISWSYFKAESQTCSIKYVIYDALSTSEWLTFYSAPLRNETHLPQKKKEKRRKMDDVGIAGLDSQSAQCLQNTFVQLDGRCSLHSNFFPRYITIFKISYQH